MSEMSTDTTVDLRANEMAALQRRALDERHLSHVAGNGSAPAVEFRSAPDESTGFQFLVKQRCLAVKAFKLYEVACSQIGHFEHTAALSLSEKRLLERMFGDEFARDAGVAYRDCKSQTADLSKLTQLGELASWRLSEFIQLYENVMAHGLGSGHLEKSHAEAVLHILVRDFGEYYGLLCDDSEGSTSTNMRRLAQFLVQFRQSKLFKSQVPVEVMTRIPISSDSAKRLLDHEIARGIEPHDVAVRERIINGTLSGDLDEADPVAFKTHRLSVRYTYNLDPKSTAVVNAILPVFAASVFDGFTSLAGTEAYIQERRAEIKLQEQQCFAILECLSHFKGKLPGTMKEFRAKRVMKAAQKAYRNREKRNIKKKASTTGGMFVEAVTGAWRAVAKPIAFSWPEDTSMFTLPGYGDKLAFFAHNVSIRDDAGDPEQFVFMCHIHRDKDPDADRPLMFEYQATIEKKLLFDPHAAARDLFKHAPEAFLRTLDAAPVLLFAKDEVLPGETTGKVDLEELKLLGTYLTLNGGMKSWVAQKYILSDRSADQFLGYPDVKAVVQRQPHSGQLS